MSTHAKLDHALRYIVRRALAQAPSGEKEGKGSRAPQDRSALVERFYSTPELARHATRDGKVDVLVTTNDAARASKHIERLGGIAHGRPRARIITARIPIDRILEAADDHSIVRMRLSEECEPYLDLANRATKLTDEGGERFFPSELGEGVLVGVIDSGIDVLHPTFAETDKPTRIIAYWDQTNDEKYGEGFKPIVDAAKTSPDTSGHGTAVASTAAGNGRGSPDGVMVGVAPQAKIAVVKTTMLSADIVNAMNWLYEIADKHDLPLVINMSLGSQRGGHDGYDELSQHIDDNSDKGRIVVVAAGNEGEADIHAMHDLNAQSPVWVFEFQPRLSPSSADPSVLKGQIIVEVWGNRHDGVDLILQDPRGFGYHAPINSHDHVELEGPGYTGHVDKDRENITSDVYYTIVIDVESDDKRLRGPWAVQAKLRAAEASDKPAEPVRMHAWVTRTSAGKITRGASRSYLIGWPGASRAAITCGAYVTRTEWVTSTAKLFKANRLRVGELADFSSPGPTRDERLKPDLTGPGYWVGMAKSSRSKVDPLYQIGQSAYFVDAGTSFASPYIAGAVALLLQIDRQLSPAEAKLLLQGTAKAETPATSWGSGTIDCKRLLQEATKLLRPAKRLASGA